MPLRILGLGLGPGDPVQADVYLLTGRRPSLLPAPGRAGAPGVVLERSQPASAGLLADLRSDRGMGWLPGSGMWLSYLRVDATAGQLTHDLAVDADGRDRPSPVAAGLVVPGAAGEPATTGTAGTGGGWWPWPALPVGLGLAVAGAAAVVLARRGRSALG